MKALALTVAIMIASGTFDCLGSAFAKAQEESERPEVAKKIQQYLANNFGMKGYKTSWYDNIVGVTLRGETVIVRTNLDSKEEKASRICGAVSGFVFSNENRSLSLKNVQVYGSDGQLLINRRGLSERCS